MKIPLLFLAVILVLTPGRESRENVVSRRKRFLDPHSFSLLPESLLRFSQEAKEFRDKFSSHAQRTLSDFFSEGMPFQDRIHETSPFSSWKSDNVAAPQRRVQNSQIEKEDFEPVVDVVEVDEPVVSGGELPETPDPFFHGSVLHGPFFRFGLFTPWWKGPNICIERSDVEESEASNFTGMNFNFESTQCAPTDSAYICTKRTHKDGVKRTVVIRHQCCHGFTRKTDGRPGCTQLKMDNLIDTMNDLGATKFVHAIETFNLKEKLLSGNFTVFCPTNEAMIDFEDETEENEIILERRLERRSTSDKASLISGHIAEGFYNYDTMDNEQILNSINEKPIRINKYCGPNSVFTANCVPVTAKNHFATNGVIHFVPEVLRFPTKTIAGIIDSDPQFTILKELLRKSRLDEKLKNPKETWTLFAPTDSAFMEMDQSLLKDMREGNRCVESTIKQHLVPSTICSPALNGLIHVQNLLENRLLLTRGEDDNIRVDGEEIVGKDILGTNGVVHIIEGVMIPPQAKTILESLEEDGRGDLLDLIELADLTSAFEKFENVTFFAPSKDAVQEISNSTINEWQENPSKLKDVLLYHVITPKKSAFTFQNNQQLTSKLDDKKIQIRLHETFPGIVTSATAQCARIVNSDNEACGAYVQIINKVLIPPKESILAALKDLEGHNTFFKLIENSGLEDRLMENGPITLLVPSDEAFEYLSEGELDEFLENKTKAEQLVKMHILPELLCCAGATQISPFQRHYVRTEEGSLLPLYRYLHNRVRFGRARAVKCDIMAENGIIHTINRVLLPPKRIVFDFGLFSIF